MKKKLYQLRRQISKNANSSTFKRNTNVATSCWCTIQLPTRLRKSGNYSKATTHLEKAWCTSALIRSWFLIMNMGFLSAKKKNYYILRWTVRRSCAGSQMRIIKPITSRLFLRGPCTNQSICSTRNWTVLKRQLMCKWMGSTAKILICFIKQRTLSNFSTSKLKNTSRYVLLPSMHSL